MTTAMTLCIMQRWVFIAVSSRLPSGSCSRRSSSSSCSRLSGRLGHVIGGTSQGLAASHTHPDGVVSRSETPLLPE